MKHYRSSAAVLLTPEKVTISNIPDIVDVNLLIELLADMGVKTNRTSRDTCEFQADDVNIDFLNSAEFRKKAGASRFRYDCRPYACPL